MATTDVSDRLDALLIRVANQRDKEAFTQLFHALAPKLMGLAMRHVRNETQAREIIQEAMLQVWQKAHLFDIDRGNAVRWIYTIGRNQCFDALRKSKHQPRVSADDLWPSTMPEDEESQEQGPDELLLSSQLVEFCNALPPAQAEVIKWVYLEQRTQAEVAELLAIPLGTVKSRLRLALARLKQLMGDAS